MGSREDFEAAVARLFRRKLTDEGWIFVERDEILRAAEEEDIPSNLADLYVQALVDRGVIYSDSGSFRGGEQLILDYEQNVDRDAFYASNAARRELLEAAARAFERNEEVEYRRDSPDNYTSSAWNEARTAAWTLQAFGLGTLDETMGGNFDFALTAAGYELTSDPAALAASLPTNREEEAEQDQPSGAAGEGLPEIDERVQGRDGRPGVFISYSHRDQEFVLALVDELQSRGVRVWIDKVELAIGDSLVDRISEAIVEEDFLVAIVSRHSVESGWCQRELAIAMNEGIDHKRVKVLPIRLGDVVMPLSLRGIVWGEAGTDATPSAIADELARAVRRHSGGTEQPASQEIRGTDERSSAEHVATDYDQAKALDGLARVGERLIDLVEQWDRCRNAGGSTDDLRAYQRRLRHQLDLLPQAIANGLPLVGEIAQAEWENYFRIRDYREMELDVDEELRVVRSLVSQGLPVRMRWSVSRFGGTVDTNRDASSYLWWISLGSGERPVTVHISRSAIASANAFLPDEVVRAKETQGRTVVVGLLGLDDPPREVVVTTAGMSWIGNEEAQAPVSREETNG